MQSLDGHIALVTGGSRGIGRAIVLGLANAGAHVAFTYHQRTNRARDVVTAVERAGRQSLSFQADVVDFDAAQAVVDRLLESWGGLHILVNNAGIHENLPIWEMSEDMWDRVLAVNLKGTFNYIRAVAPHFLDQRHGKIVNIASIHGLRGRQEGPNYSAAKAGVIGLTKSVARDLGPFDVNVNAVAPGVIETDMVQGLSERVIERFMADITLGRMGTPEDVAHLVVFLCSRKGRHIHGEVVKIDGGQYI